MSPLIVGLILCCLIGVSSSSNYSNNPYTRPLGALVQLKNNANHSSFAKDNMRLTTKPFPGAQRTPTRVTTSPRLITRTESMKYNGSRNRTPSRLHLNTRMKVKNASESNSTIIYIPRLSRSMGNFSRTSGSQDLQPIIVSKHRRILLDPKEYKTRRSSDSWHPSPKTNSSLHYGSKLKHKISQNSTHASNPAKFNSRTSSLTSRKVRLTQTPNIRKGLKSSNTNTKFYTESKTLVDIQSIHNRTSTKNPFVLQFLPVNISRKENRIFSRNHGRRGKSVNLSNEESSEEIISITPLEAGTMPPANNKREPLQKLRSSSSWLPTIKRSSYQQNLPSSENFTEQPLSDLGYSYAEKKAKNLTVYEILKPRLKTNASEMIDFSSNQNSFSLQNDAMYHQIKDIGENETANVSKVSFVHEEDAANNNTSAVNEIHDGIPKIDNSMLITPSRSDLTFGVRYIMVNRSNFAIVPPPKSNGTHLYMNDKDFRNNTNSSVVTFSEKAKTGDSGSGESYLDETAFFQKDLLRKRNEDSISINKKNNDNLNKSVPYNNSGENLSADGSEYMTQLYESDPMRRPKMTENINNGNTPFKNPKIDSKMFYDYFAKRPSANSTLRDFPYPEYRPGNMFRYSDIYQRKPILDAVLTQPSSVQLLKTEPIAATEEPEMNPTTFNSLRSSVRSTYYPNRFVCFY